MPITWWREQDHDTAANVESPVEFGGYFGLDLPDRGDAFPAAIKLQSGRAALRAVLESAGIERVLMPAYICDSMVRAAIDAGSAVETYRLDDSLYPKSLPDALPANSAVLYVNYFGLCAAGVGRLREDIPHDRLIIDNSQALFTRAADVLATIYSPRKFVGVPDGGLLVAADLAIEAPADEDAGSVARARHLLVRLACMAQEGYAHYLESESSLVDTRPMRMSRLTRRMLASIDMEAVRRRRRENFVALASRLGKYNSHRCDLDAESVPLCYPLVVGWDVERLREHLRGKAIYLPTYWPEVRARVSGGIEHRLANCCLMVPCDQRYSARQMSCLADEIVAALDNHAPDGHFSGQR